MKFLVALVIAMVVIHMGFCDVMADLKKDFDAAELGEFHFIMQDQDTFPFLNWDITPE